jgi:methyltransferase (TIGR00027 family)
MTDTSSLITAEGACRGRALQWLYLDPPPFNDDWALQLLRPEDRERLRQPQSRAEFMASPISFTMTGVGVGSLLYAEETVLEAVSAGVDQYVILGAGFDTFAMRHGELVGALRVFEVDHPAVQALKRERLAAAPPVILMPDFVAVDFEVEKLGERLHASGFDSSRPAMFSWMNTLPYLSVDAITATLRDIRDVTAPGSILVTNYPVSGVPTSAEQLAVMEATRADVSRRGEPWQSNFTPDAFVAVLAECGFDVEAHLTEHDINARFFADRTDGFKAAVPLRIVKAVRRYERISPPARAPRA